MELISVIVPVYNIELYIEECIKSILNQTYGKIEILLIDDGSTDRSGEICRKYAQIDSRIKVLRKENGGLSSARNYGMNYAMGDYYLFVDGDDTVEEDICQKLWDLLKKENAEIVISALYREKKKGQRKKGRIERYNSKTAIKQMLKEKTFNTSAWGKLFKKELFDGIEFPENKIYEDLGTIYKVFHKAEKIIFYNMPLYYYRKREGSIMLQSFHKKKLDIIDISEEQIEFLKKCYPSLERTAYNRLVRYCISFFKEIAQSKDMENPSIPVLQNCVRKGYPFYLLSGYKATSKMFGLLLCFDYRMACKVYGWLSRIKNESDFNCF